MKKITLFLLFLLAFTSFGFSQTYHPHDVEALKRFMLKPSNGIGELNLDIFRIVNPDTTNNWKNFNWEDSTLFLGWTDDTPKRLQMIYWGEEFEPLEDFSITKTFEVSDDWTPYEYMWSLSDTLDLSDCAGLTYLKIKECSIPFVRLDNCKALESFIYIRDTELLDSIDLSTNINLKSLLLRTPKLKSLNLNNNLNLEHLLLSVGYIKDLDFTYNKNLMHLQFAAFDLNSVKLGNLENLQTLECNLGQSKLLDVSNCSNLSNLSFYGDKLEKLDLSHNKNLGSLDCRSAENLSQLNLDGLTNLGSLRCSSTSLKSLDVSSFVNLTTLSCKHSQLSYLDVSKNKYLYRLDCSDNQNLKQIKLGDLKNLAELWCSNNLLDLLDVREYTNLKSLDCSSNKNLTQLKLGKLGNLDYLNCSNTLLDSLDVRECTNLISLYCSETQLASLDIGQNKKLYDLDCRRSNFVFSTLPTPAIDSTCAIYYSPQRKFYISSNENREVDLSRFEYKNKTVFNWYLEESNSATKLLDIESLPNNKFLIPAKYKGKSIICKMTNSDFPNFRETEENESYLSYSPLICEVAVPFSSGIEEINSSARVYGNDGELIVESDKPAQVEVYTVSGVLVKKQKLEAGTITFKLSQGFYIVKVNKDVFKCRVQ